MGTIFISIIMVCRIFQHLFNKRASSLIDSIRTCTRYNAFTMLISAVMGFILLFISSNGFSADIVTLLISTFSGIMLATSSFCGLLAMQSGTMTANSMFATGGLIIPCLFGIFLFGEPVSVLQWVGIAIFMVAAYFLTSDSKKTYGSFNKKTLLLLLGSMFSNGFVMLAQQMFTFYRPEANVSVFSALSFAIPSALLFILTPFMPKKENAPKPPKRLYFYGVILAAAVFVINQLATISTALVSPVILFSFINGGSTIIGTVVAFICFGEKLNKEKITGLILGISSLLVIKMF